MFYALCSICGLLAGWFLRNAFFYYPDSFLAQAIVDLEKRIEHDDIDRG